MNVAHGNPFHPQFGKRPDKFIGRDNIIAGFVNSLQDKNDPQRTLIVTGIRGSGKTALLSGVKQAIDSKHHVVVDVTAGPELRQSVLDQLQLAFGTKKSKLTGVNVGALGFSVGFETAAAEKNHGFRYYLTLLVEEFGKKDRGVVFLIDEVQGDDDGMREFVTTFQHFVRDGADVALLMAGLPHSIYAVLNSKLLTFLHRAQKMTLPGINLLLVRNMYQITFSKAGFEFDEDILQKSADATKGFPYLVQLIGYWLWKTDTKILTQEDADTALVNAKAALFDNVYELMLRELSGKDREFLCAMLEDADNSGFGDLMKRMDVDAGYASKYRQRLIQGGLIRPVMHGYLEYAAPYFREFLSLQMTAYR